MVELIIGRMIASNYLCFQYTTARSFIHDSNQSSYGIDLSKSKICFLFLIIFNMKGLVIFYVFSV